MLALILAAPSIGAAVSGSKGVTPLAEFEAEPQERVLS